jgi:hypothetical protein
VFGSGFAAAARRGKDRRSRNVCLMTMEPNGIHSAHAVAVVMRAIRAIDESGDDQRNALLCDLLCAAWGSFAAQNQ